MIATPTVGILIGGDSDRMGCAKALLPVDETTLVERTAAVAATVSDKVVLLGRPPFELPGLVSTLTLIEDLHPDIGPMAGLEALLYARPDDPCMLLACDMPHLTGALLERLGQVPEGRDAVVCRTGGPSGRWHPCCATYRSSALAAIDAAVAQERFGMNRLLSQLSVQAVDLTDNEARWVENWNEPEDVRP